VVAKETKKDLDLDAKDAAGVKGGQKRVEMKAVRSTKSPAMTKKIKKSAS
jgi:hypothetical protein